MLESLISINQVSEAADPSEVGEFPTREQNGAVTSQSNRETC